MSTRAEDPAKRAYQAMARFYDGFTSGYGYQYGKWSGALLAKAQELGATGDRLLDVACGTGLSFAVPLERGWRVTACDISPAMIEAARAKVGGRAELHVADMRELPALGEFDLAWALNNPIGYLADVEELTATLAGMRRNLAPGGLAVFDATTLKVFRSFFGEKMTVDHEGRTYVWEGQLDSPAVEPGAVGEGRFEVLGDDVASVHRMRYFGPEEARAAIEAAGLTPLEVFGEVKSRLEPELDEERHTAAAYFCRA